MSFLVYFGMLIVALVSVMMGLQVVSAPPPARTAARPALVEPIRHATPAKPAKPAESVKPATPATTVKPATPAEPARPSVAQEMPPAPEPAQQTVSQSAEDAQASAPAAEPGPACNVSACEAAYQSFRASDCTYQPYEGPRRLCTK